VLSAEDNEILTRVGPGTPMGTLLRRYWIPACLSSEIGEPDGAPVRVRLLGEDLVAFRDTAGAVGLIEERCPHRGASLFYGRNEESGLRCTYHGWKFDVSGQCTDQRSEIRSFAHRIKTTSYPVHESGGIVWAYLGPPAAMTPFRDFGTDSLPSSLVGANKETIYCNWVQSLDGDLDTAHISNLHQFDAIDDIADDGTDKPGSYSGIADFRSQDAMATETAGPIFDRTAEHLGSTDVALIRMHRLLLRAAKALADDPAAADLPALAGPDAGDFRAIRGAEKILAGGEDWRYLGTDADPTVREALG